MKVVHWHLDSNTIMPRAFYIFVWESMYACEMLITKKVSPWSRASEHPTTVQAPFDKLCFVSRLSKISWELICAGLMVRYHVSERNAKCWKYCAWGSLRSDRRKESKSLRGKISFHSNYSSSVQVASRISNLSKSSPVNRPIFLRAKTHPSSVATSPEFNFNMSVMVMVKLSVLVARRVKSMILVVIMTKLMITTKAKIFWGSWWQKRSW